MSFERCTKSTVQYTNFANQFSRALGVLFLCMLISLGSGCSDSSENTHKDHGGHLIDLAGHEEMKLEFSIDEELNKLIVYVLATTSLKPYPISSKNLVITFQVDGEDTPVSLAADPLPSDPERKSSRFTISSADLPDSLYGAADFVANFTLNIQGETVSGTLDHHDDHTHHHD